eukprot:2371286-Pyramimonas_sp.AAC.1
MNSGSVQNGSPPLLGMSRSTATIFLMVSLRRSRPLTSATAGWSSRTYSTTGRPKATRTGMNTT